MDVPAAPLHYQNGSLHINGASLEDLAGRFGTPLYVYSADHIRDRVRAFQRGIGDRRARICYALKANSNLAIVSLMAGLDVGADIVSGGELYRCLKAGMPAERIVFAGVGKSETEIREALKADILMFSVESEQELERIAHAATTMGRVAPIGFRVNPDVDAQTHPYISTGLRENKFGVSHERVRGLYRKASTMPGVRIRGIGFHIGSQLLRLDGFRDAARIARDLIEELTADGMRLEHIDVGGGLGIAYTGNEEPPDLEDYARLMREELPFPDMTLVFEPGRSLVGNAGILLTRVEYTKENEGRRFIVVDAGMNDLIRPALYEAYHQVHAVDEATARRLAVADLVGPICETGDFLARERDLPEAKPGDLLAVASAGAYGFVMSSNYNSRPRAAEVLVDGDLARLVRERESYGDLVQGERL